MQKMNFHTHTQYCDGTGSPEVYVEAALDRGFIALGFSGHAPLPFPNSWTMDEDSLPRYLSEIRKLRELNRDRIEIYLGLETDFLDPEQNAGHPRLDPLGLDFQISSVHMLYDPSEKIYCSVDGPVEELQHLISSTFDGSPRRMIEAYYLQVQKMLRIGGFDIIGHFDLIKKHNRSEKFFSEDEDWYRRIIEETLNAAAASGKILEVNTGAMSRGYTDEPYPSPWILEICADLGIPVMLNADAHKPEHIDYAFRETERMLRKAGYSHGWGLLQNRWQEVAFDG